MQIGLRLHDGEKLPLEELLPKVREKGFKCGHLALSKSLSPDHMRPGVLTPGFAMYLKRLFEKNELDIAVLGCYLNLADPDEDKLKANTEKYMAHIRFAALAGVGVVGTETGAPNSAYKYEPACHTQKALETFTENLRPIVGYAEKMGVILAIEPVYKHIVYTPQAARYVLDTVNSPNLQIIFDPVNLLHPDNLHRREEVLSDAMELLGKDIAVVHIKDYIQKEGELVSVAAGTGEMDYREIMSFIKREKPFIHVTLENTSPDNSQKSRAFIEKIYEEV